MQSRREVKRFQALSKSGKLYTVIEWERVVSQTLISGRTLTASGSREWLLLDGRDVNPISGGRFQILQTDEILEVIAADDAEGEED